MQRAAGGFELRRAHFVQCNMVYRFYWIKYWFLVPKIHTVVGSWFHYGQYKLLLSVSTISIFLRKLDEYLNIKLVVCRVSLCCIAHFDASQIPSKQKKTVLKYCALLGNYLIFFQMNQIARLVTTNRTTIGQVKLIRKMYFTIIISFHYQPIVRW